ncbi:MAG: deoxynucleoside kinase [Aerococcus sp.]|nr:deoxynucleoside kinase [Aerococcus sp.]
MIILAGVMGAGKTTYSKRLAQALGSEVFLESVSDNPILEKFYENPKRYAFALQLHFLNTRFRSMKQAYQGTCNVLDRTIYEDQIFTWNNVEKGNISKEEWAIYCQLVDHMIQELQQIPKKSPDLLVYLDVSFEHELANIKKRGREFEQVESDPTLVTYYRNLYDKYQEWIENYTTSAKLIIPADHYDIEKPADWEEVLGMITSALEKLEVAVAP